MNDKLLGSLKSVAAALAVALSPWAIPAIQSGMGTAKTPVAVAVYTLAGLLFTWLVPNKGTAGWPGSGGTAPSPDFVASRMAPVGHWDVPADPPAAPPADPAAPAGQ